jgi:hypothetical protein
VQESSVAKHAGISSRRPYPAAGDRHGLFPTAECQEERPHFHISESRPPRVLAPSLQVLPHEQLQHAEVREPFRIATFGSRPWAGTFHLSEKPFQ